MAIRSPSKRLLETEAVIQAAQFEFLGKHLQKLLLQIFIRIPSDEAQIFRDGVLLDTLPNLISRGIQRPATKPLRQQQIGPFFTGLAATAP